MKVKRIGDGWYQITREDGVRAGFRYHHRGTWGVYFRNADNSCAFGMQPGEELWRDNRAEAEQYARQVLRRNAL